MVLVEGFIANSKRCFFCLHCLGDISGTKDKDRIL